MKNMQIKTNHQKIMSRRKFLWLTSLSVSGFIAGCAINPVSGKSQLMLISESKEIEIDKQNSPHQFSTDYGALQDKKLNDYIELTGKKIAARTHRPNLPYSFRGVNATYINAYAFPGGSIAVTRGMLLKLENEAELAALLGHEIGHVNARHTAGQMSRGMLTQVIVVSASAYAGLKNPKYSELAAALGMIGSGALLASYSRNNEREADSLGMEYMVASGYSSKGMVGLMTILKGLSKHKPTMTELLFATHPMSDERYETAVSSAESKYAATRALPLNRQRFMDHTANLRKIKGAIQAIQEGESAMARKEYPKAETHFKTALQQAPDDYAALVLMSKCLLAQKKNAAALRYAEQAKKTYPNEAQAIHLSGFSKIKKKNFEAAYDEFTAYDNLLPGNPNTLFFKGLALEGMHQYKAAANSYNQYLQMVNQGDQAKYSYGRLVKWGYLKPE